MKTFTDKIKEVFTKAGLDYEQDETAAQLLDEVLKISMQACSDAFQAGAEARKIKF